MPRYLAKAGFALLVGVMLIWSLFPLWYAVVASFSRDTELYVPHYFPPGAYWGNFIDLFHRTIIVRAMVNSLVVGLGVLAICLALALPAATALTRLGLPGSRPILLVILATTMFPQAAVLAGFFEMFHYLGLFNTLLAVMLADLVLVLPFSVWLIAAYLRALPRELDDMAALDGTPPLLMLRRIYLPLLWPGLVASGLLAFIAVWNEFLFAFTFTMTESQRTAPVAVALLWGYTPHDTPWGTLMAACVVMTLPAAGLVLIFQRRMVSGLTTGAVNG